MRKSLVTALFLLVALPCFGQAIPQLEASGSYSFLCWCRMGEKFNGVQGNFTGVVNRWLGLTGEFAAHYRSPGDIHESWHSILFGPTLYARADPKFTPSIHFLFGRISEDFTESTTHLSDSGFGYSLGGALDYGLNDVIAVRVLSLDYQHAHLFSSGRKYVRLGAGLTFRFGSHG